jgi:hypothetical protein
LTFPRLLATLLWLVPASNCRQTTYSYHLTIGVDMVYWICCVGTVLPCPACHALAPRGPSNSFPFRPSHSVTFLPTAHVRKSFRCNTCRQPRKCCKQKTYGKPNSCRCNTYKKAGVGVLPSEDLNHRLNFSQNDQKLSRSFSSITYKLPIFYPLCLTLNHVMGGG